jgi:hypothetical protein
MPAKSATKLSRVEVSLIVHGLAAASSTLSPRNDAIHPGILASARIPIIAADVMETHRMLRDTGRSPSSRYNAIERRRDRGENIPDQDCGDRAQCPDAPFERTHLTCKVPHRNRHACHDGDTSHKCGPPHIPQLQTRRSSR